MAFASYSGDINYAAQANNGGNHVKGAYVELVASTPWDSSRFWFHMQSHSSSIRAWLTDFSKGAAAAETVVVANMSTNSSDGNASNGHDGPCDADFECYADIAAGTRLAFRGQSDTASTAVTIFCKVMIEDRALNSRVNPVTYATNSSGASWGTTIDAGAVANTKGSYTELTAATSQDHDAWMINVANRANLAPTACYWNLDIATGAIAAEVIIFPDLMLRAITVQETICPLTRTLRFTVASGTRLSARTACTTTDSFDRTFDMQVIGMQDKPLQPPVRPVFDTDESSFVFSGTIH